MTTPRQYLLWDNIERGAFWKPGKHGYTCDINQAGRYDKETARGIVANAGVSEDGIPDTIMVLEPTGRIPLPPTSGLVHAAADAAMEAVVARLQPWATEPHGDLRIGAKRAALMAVDAAAPILLAAGRSQVEPRRAQEEDLLPWIRRATCDPGSIAGRRRGPSWKQDEEGYAEEQEAVSDWVQRAVLAVLAKDGRPHCERCCQVIRVDDAYDPPLPGIGLWEHKGVCPPAAEQKG